MFIVFEGMNGVGKTTQAELLHSFLKEEGHDIAPIMKESIYCTEALDGLPRRTHLWIWTASRAVHNVSLDEHLAAGRTVICDRYIGSTVAYQSEDYGADFIEAINKNFIQPTIVILLDMPVDKVFASEDEDTKSVRARFLRQASQEHWVVVDANDTIENVHNKIRWWFKK